MQTYQVEALHREKLVTLGTMAAGLMHELHNPVSAAKRAAAQLRENLKKLQELALRMGERPKTREQLECIKGLLEHAVGSCQLQAMSSMEQADAEERMSEWLAAAQVENAYTIGPALVEMGFDEGQLQCAQGVFRAGSVQRCAELAGRAGVEHGAGVRDRGEHRPGERAGAGGEEVCLRRAFAGRGS